MVEWVDFQGDPDYSGTSNQGISSVTFDYKQHCLKTLDACINESLDCKEIEPKEIYDTIVNSLIDLNDYHQQCLNRGQELLSMVQNNYCFEEFDVSNYSYVQEASYDDWVDFWENSN